MGLTTVSFSESITMLFMFIIGILSLHLDVAAASSSSSSSSGIISSSRVINPNVARLQPLFNQWMKKHSVNYGVNSSDTTGTVDADGDINNKGYYDDDNDSSPLALLADDDEYYHRLHVYYNNSLIVERHNEAYKNGLTTYNMTLLETPFADLTDDEFISKYLMESQNCSATTTTSTTKTTSDSALLSTLPITTPYDDTDNNKIPEFVDWRTKGIVTPIKNQQHCGSCWTFSTSGTLEAHTCLKHRHGQQHGHEHGSRPNLDCTTWTGLSEQQLLDCAWNYDNQGCNGGLPSHAFEYIKYAGGLETEVSYPYRANDSSTCRATKTTSTDDDINGSINKYQNQHANHNHHVAKVIEVYNITSRDEDDLVYAIANIGPVSVAYQVTSDFRFYSHGVYDSYNATTNSTNCNDDNLSVNHAVVAVGYGTTQPKDPTDKTFVSQPYYIVRNSWSTSWGMEGYFWILRNKNLCGISDCASFPIVGTPPSVENIEEEVTKEGRRK